jgi:broad specificity phosphatase PhoE
MIIFAIRHAATKAEEGNRILGRVNEKILNSEIKRIRVKAKELKALGISQILSSPLQRTVQTAEIIANELNLSVEICEDLAERDFGILSGLTWEEFIKKYPHEVKDNNARFQPNLKGAESIQDVEIRVKNLISKLKKRNGNLLLVTHSGVIRILLRILSNYSAEQSREGISNLQVFKFDY